MEILTILMIIAQAIVGISHGADKIHQHMKKKKKQKIEQVKVEVKCNEKEDDEE